MKKPLTFKILMAICAIAAIYSVSEWKNTLLAIMFILALGVFMVTLWYVTATEMPEDYDQERIDRYLRDNGYENN